MPQRPSISPVLALASVALAAVVAAPSVALADEPDVQHSVSLTFSPIHLAFPMFEATGEARLGDKLGAALILAGGTVGVTVNNVEQRGTAYEVGGQVRWYPVGSFIHGLQVGAELLYLHISLDDAYAGTVNGAGLALGPFIGYKIATNVGFTFDAQLGFEWMAARAESSSASAEAKSIIPLLNLNVGWSF